MRQIQQKEEGNEATLKSAVTIVSAGAGFLGIVGLFEIGGGSDGAN